jgi:hypothetical protein
MSFLLGMFIGVLRALVVVSGLSLRKRHEEYLTMAEWCSAAYSVMELGAQLMPRDLMDKWTGVHCILDSCPTEVHEYE